VIITENEVNKVSNLLHKINQEHQERIMPKPNFVVINDTVERLYVNEENKLFVESAISGNPLPEGVDRYDVFMELSQRDPIMFVLAFLDVVDERNRLDESCGAAEDALDILLRRFANISLESLDELLNERWSKAHPG